MRHNIRQQLCCVFSRINQILCRPRSPRQTILSGKFHSTFIVKGLSAIQGGGEHQFLGILAKDNLDILRWSSKIKYMAEKAIHIEKLPRLTNPVLIAGFDGWGNALNISKGMVAYLIRKLNKTEYFAKINPDRFYRYDETRPIVHIVQGELKGLSMPGGSFYFARIDSDKHDLVILKADEPHLRWFHYVEELLCLCEKLNVETIITLGSLYDNVLHSDRIVSGYTSDKDLLTILEQKHIIPSHYQGPSSIQSLIHSEGKKRGFLCINLWCHCPYYLQGATHFGILSHLGSLLSFLGEFELDTEELDASWNEMNNQIQSLVENNPKVKSVIEDIQKAKKEGSWASVRASIQRGEKVISIEDLLKPK